MRGVMVVSEFAHEALQASSVDQRAAKISDLNEVLDALLNNYRSPLPEKLGFLYALKFFSPEWRRNIGTGTTPARNLQWSVHDADISKRDPLPSTYWERRTNIASEDLYVGFGREALPSFSQTICTYDGPKSGYGTTPGIEVDFDGARYKIKFAEYTSEPFVARLFWALGFHVDETDYSPQILIRYDRRMFREFNLHKSISIILGGPFGIPMGSLQLQPVHDPFRNVVSAVFKDGHSVSGSELKTQLLIDSSGKNPEEKVQNFRPEVEAQIDHLVMSVANVQPKDTPAESIGAWSYEGLGHENLREVRGAGLLAAWAAFCDTRWENTRLRVAYKNGHAHLEHFFSDLGFGMGGGNGFSALQGENPNAFTWTFTHPAIVRGRGQMTTPFRVQPYRTIVPTRAFHEMTLDDARWMARQIGQLTEEQIRAALIASGYNAAEVKLYQEKLVSRRDAMIRDLGLTGEIPLLRPHGIARKFDFDPQTDGAVAAMLPSQKQVFARESDEIIKGGQVVQRPGKAAVPR
jgi:hypothetical protein